MKPYLADEERPLLETLLIAYPEAKKTKLKQLLKYGAVMVNGRSVTQFDHPVEIGDEIVIRNYKPEFKQKDKISLSFPIVYEDERLIVIDKPAGLLTMANEKEKFETAYFELTAYARACTRDGSGRVFIVHRLDRDASGILLFAKDEEMKRALQANWESVEKKYYAVVEGRPARASDTIEGHLVASDKSMKVKSTHPSEHSVFAQTRYIVLGSNKYYSLLEVAITTGRKHQIRVHLADIGCPIIGDKKYGAQSDPAGRLGLHAFHLAVTDPETGQEHIFRSELPADLNLVRIKA